MVRAAPATVGAGRLPSLRISPCHFFISGVRPALFVLALALGWSGPWPAGSIYSLIVVRLARRVASA